MTENDNPSKYSLMFLWIIIGIAFFLRVYGLTYQSLWNDELSSWTYSDYDSIDKVIEEGVKPDVHPPGYILLLHFSNKLFGTGEAALRFPSVLAGILAVWVIYQIGVYFYSSREGLVVACLMAVMHIPIYYSQEVRPYAFVILLGMVTALMFFKIIRNLYQGNKISWWFVTGYIVAAAATCYLHYFGILLIVSYGLYWLIFSILSRKLRPFLLLAYCHMGILLLYAPWFASLWKDFQVTDSWISIPSIPYMIGYFKVIFNKSWIITGVVFLLYSYLIFEEFPRMFKKYRSRLAGYLSDPTIFIFCWIIIPIVVVVIKSLLSTPVFTYRNMVICLPAFVLLLGRAITLLPVYKKYQYSILMLTGIVFILHLVFIRQYYTLPVKEQFREAAAYLIENTEDEDNVCVFVYVYDPKFYTYYFRHFDSNLTVNALPKGIRDIGVIEKRLANSSVEYFWILSGHLYPDDAFMDDLNEKYMFVEEKSFISARASLFLTGEPVKK